MSQWDRNIDSFQRLQTDLGFLETLRVYNATTSYDPDTGDTSKSYSEVAESPVDAEIVPPTESGEQEPAGTLAEADVMIYVRDDTGIDFKEYGEPSEAATEVEVINTGERYRLQTKINEQNGLLKFAATEL